MRRGRALAHLGALWRALAAAFRKQYMGLGTGLRAGARDWERKVCGVWSRLKKEMEHFIGLRTGYDMGPGTEEIETCTGGTPRRTLARFGAPWLRPLENSTWGLGQD